MAEKRKNEELQATNNVPFTVDGISETIQWITKGDPTTNLKQIQQRLADDAVVKHQVVSDLKRKKIKYIENNAEIKKVYQKLNDSSYIKIDFENQTAHFINASVKTSRFCHPVYLTPSLENPEESLQLILTLAKKERDMFIIKSTEFILENKIIKKDEKNFDQKKFLSQLPDLNKMLSVDNPIRYEIQEGKLEFFATMVHLGNISLCKEFGSQVEKEAVECLLKLSQLDNPTDDEQAHTNGANDHTQKDYVTEESPEPKEIFYESQKAIGDHIFAKITQKLMESNKFQSELDMLKFFEDFRFLILLPNRISLETQTKSRLKEVLRKFPESLINQEDISHVIRICKSSTMERSWDNFVREAERNPKTMFLVVHDECHWASGENQSAFKFMGFPDGDYHYTRDEKKTILPNLFTLMVSATPYNIYTLIQDQTKVVSWKEYLKSQGKENDYQGLTELRQQGKVFSANQVPKLTSNSDILIANGFSKEFVHLILGYLNALKSYKENPEERKETDYLKQCIEEKKLIVIRVAKAKNNIRGSVVAQKVINTAICILKLKLEVCINAENNKKPNRNVDINYTNFNFEEHLHLVLKRIKKRTNNGDIKKDSVSKLLQFSDVDHIPMIMIIIERGRMGDTFPQNCVCFDLRARYLAPVEDFTSIIQDVGRAFGYGKRPSLLLSKEADKFLSEIWDTATDSLSMETLKTKTRVVLGNHMKRIVQDDYVYNDITSNDEDEDEDDENFEVASDLQLVNDIFEANPDDAMFLYKLVPAAFEHRLLLKAEPQNGKTGAFLYLIKLFCDKIRPNSKKSMKWKSPLGEHTKYFYFEKTNEEIEQEFTTPNGKKRHLDYIKLLKFARNKRASDNILEPAKWAALALVNHLKENPQEQIMIADFGCGDMQFTKFLVEEIKTNDLLKKMTQIHITGYDFSTNEIEDIQDLPPNTIVVPRTGINCSKETNFRPEIFDFIISTCALFGKGDSWKMILSTAFHALKTKGILFLAEKFKKEPKPGMPLDIVRVIEHAGVEVTSFRKFGTLEDRTAFNEKFLARKLGKEEDYNSEELKKCLACIKRN